MFFAKLIATSMRASMSIRGAFLIEASLLLINNIIFFAIWWIFFMHFEDVSGWGLHEMAILMAIGTGGYGLSRLIGGGTRYLARMIIDGALDAFMTQPKNVLIHAACSRSQAKGWGHLASGLCFIILADLFEFQTIFLISVGIICSALVFASAAIVSHSLAFWLGPIEPISERYCESLFLFALYPTNIYSDILQLIMFTVIPAGIIGYLPVEMVRDFTWGKLAILLVSTSTCVFLAWFIFFQGLKRYESGNQIG